MKKYNFIQNLIIFICIIIGIAGLVFLSLKIKNKKLAERFPQQPITIAQTEESASINKFNLIGQVKNLNQIDKKITVNIITITSNFQDKTNTDFEIPLAGNFLVENKEGNYVNLSDISYKSKIMITGSINDNQPKAEKIYLIE